MSNLHPVFAQALRPFAPRFEHTEASPLDGLYQYEHITSLGLSLRCYLEHEPAIDGGDAHPGTKEQMALVYAFAGLIDISEVLHDDVKALIEEEALTDLHQADTDSHDDAAIARWEERMAA